MTQLISNAPMQPRPDAVWRLTLIEKLEQERTRLNKQANDDIDVVSKENHAYQAHLISGLTNAIDIVKQHQAESEWISADERLPNKDGKYLVYCVSNRELTKDRKELSIMRFNQKTKGGWFALSPLFKVVYWQPIQPPSEVQDD